MKHTIHKIIYWYLRRCAGAFHCYNYGAEGRYVVLMTEGQYSNHQKASGAALQQHQLAEQQRTEFIRQAIASANLEELKNIEAAMAHIFMQRMVKIKI